MLEAVESAWTKFNDELGNAKDLDTVIRVHEQFQSDVILFFYFRSLIEHLWLQRANKYTDRSWRFLT